MSQAESLRRVAAVGWNTWNTASVLSHVYMPYAFSINLALKDYETRRVTERFLIGRFGEKEEKIHPGIRSYDGTYTELTVSVSNSSFRVESAVRDDRQFILITPVKLPAVAPAIAVSASILWNHPGYVYLDQGVLRGVLKDKTVSVFVTGKEAFESHFQLNQPYISVSLEEKIAVSTDAAVSIQEAEQIMKEAREKVMESAGKYGDLAQAYHAMRSCLAWDTIYEPEHQQVCSPVSRLWNLSWGGYVLFCWDTFFAAAMLSLEQKELAYANVFAILNELTEKGFVPNAGSANGVKTEDRSQPPVGAMTVLDIYERWQELWFVEETYEKLSQWNSWFFENRLNPDGTLSWGSDPYPVTLGYGWEEFSRQGAAFESGLDNSPMYDDIPFDEERHLMRLSDAGLTALYLNDCACMIRLSQLLGKDGTIFEQRRKIVSAGLKTLWNDSFGLFLNRRTDTGEFSFRISPTNFYPLFDTSLTEEQKTRPVREHLYSTDEFWGDYVLPSIARNDPAYPDQDYWRGRIWAPMNYLVYRALRAAGQKEACRDLAEKSKELILKEWTLHGHVHENYDGDTGMGCGVKNSDKFYHWGGLLSYIAILEQESDQ